ncbi:hypothetical protein LXA43DRAFT_939146 [Ganoderma leucocontextum]|nr:hypothetical protein LXA43DRAFT_939146 [Ganoderma leucocontextum]
MSTATLANATAAFLPFPAAALQPIIDGIEGPVNALLLNTIWCSFLIPIIIALLLSNSRNWKTPVFIMNVCAVVLGLTFGVITIYFQKRSITLNPVGPRLLLAVTCLYFFVPISTQSILLVRVIAVYPPRGISRAQQLLIYGTFTTIQTTRLVNAIIDFVKTAWMIENTTNFVMAEQAAWRLPYVKVEFILQLVYDVFASSLFLLRLHEGGALRTKQVGQPSIFTSGECGNTYASRLRGLFWIAVFNFVFPVILNVAVITFLFRDPNPEHGVNVMVVNIYVDIICVLLATVWCSGAHWQNDGPGLAGAQARVPEEVTIQSLSAATFAPPSTHPSCTQLDVEMVELTK